MTHEKMPPAWDGRDRRGPDRADDETRARKLLTDYRAGGRGADAAREALVQQFRPLVQKLARQFLTPSVSLDDLGQEGLIGLLHGLDGYDPTRGVKIITYVTHHIDGHLRHYLRDRVQIIKEPAWLQEMAQKVRRETETLLQELGREPSEAEVARINATRSTFAVTSLEEAQATGAAGAHVSESNLEAATVDLPIEEKLVLESALVRLKDIEQKVLYSFYYEDRSQTDIARALGVSNNYVSHILKNSARKLQQMFRSDAVREAALQHERRRLRLAAHGPDGDTEDAPATIIDALTGLYTRAYFEARLDEELSRARRHNLELSIIRVQVGEELHEAALFTEVAQVFKDAMRRSDLVARLDAREFAALLPHTGETKEPVRRRLQERLAALRARLSSPCVLLLGASSYPACRQRQDLLAAASPEETI